MGSTVGGSRSATSQPRSQWPLALLQKCKRKMLPVPRLPLLTSPRFSSYQLLSPII